MALGADVHSSAPVARDDDQHRLLEKASELIDTGVLRPTATVVLDGLQAATLRKAHRMVESLTMIGKVVIDYGS